MNYWEGIASLYGPGKLSHSLRAFNSIAQANRATLLIPDLGMHGIKSVQGLTSHLDRMSSLSGAVASIQGLTSHLDSISYLSSALDSVSSLQNATNSLVQKYTDVSVLSSLKITGVLDQVTRIQGTLPEINLLPKLHRLLYGHSLGGNNNLGMAHSLGMSTLQSVIDSPAIQAFNKGLQGIHFKNDLFLDETFFGSIFSDLEEALEDPEYEELEAFSIQMAKNIFRKVQEVTSNLTIADISSIVAIIISLIALSDAQQSSEKIIQLQKETYSSQEEYYESEKFQNEKLIHSINNLFKLGNEILERLDPNEEAIYYAVQREASLRAKPSTKSMELAKLFKNQRVILIKNKGQWIYVEYTDYLEGIPRLGWVKKKYLKRL